VFRNGSRPSSYISASKGCSRFSVMKLCLYLFSFQTTFKQLSSTAVLPFNEPVEAMDYDSNKCKLVLTSHTGKIKLFHVEKNGTKKATLRIATILTPCSGTLISMWTKNWNDTVEGKCVIPRSVHFTSKGENIAIFGLESGML
jgi:hypothetical protein